MSYSTAIHEALTSAALAGDFRSVSYAGDPPVKSIGVTSVAPRSCETNEVVAAWEVDPRHGLDRVMKRRRWDWTLLLRFNTEVTAERFEVSLEASPLYIPRSVDRPRQVTLYLVNAKYTHPPRVSASNGTEILYTFAAELGRL